MDKNEKALLNLAQSVLRGDTDFSELQGEITEQIDTHGLKVTSHLEDGEPVNLSIPPKRDE